MTTRTGVEVTAGTTPVYVYAADPVSEAGIVAALQEQGDIAVVAEGDIDQASVALVIGDEVDDTTIRVIRALQRNSCPRVILVVTHVDDGGLFAAVEAGVSGLLRRAEADGARLAEAIRTASAGDGTMPSDLLGRLLEQIQHIQNHVLEPRGLHFTGLTDREVAVLRLVADGCDTAEIAQSLSYSERTVKNVIQGVTSRLNLRNRSHAVAYALRQGLI